MKVLFSPQRSNEKLNTEINQEVITVKLDNQTDVFDFSSLPDGEARNIDTVLPINPIISANRKNGELSVVLLNFVGENATPEELFPQWQVID